MKPLRKYFFGYWFVRLAKVIGLLAMLATLGYIGLTTSIYFAANAGAQYGPDENLRLALNRTNEELQYAKKEVGRITNTTDLPDLSVPTLPRAVEEFEPAAVFIQQAEAQRQTLKQRTMAKLESSITTLQEKIADTIRSIERTRQDMESQPKPSTPVTPAAPVPAVPHSALDGPVRNVFGVDNTGSLHRTLEQAQNFFTNLAEKAEKEENKALLKSTLEEIGKLKSWLPKPPTDYDPIRKAVPVNPEVITSDSESSLATDPLNTALTTHRNLATTLFKLRSSITENWTLDGTLTRAATKLENERDQCRGAEVIQRNLRSAWLTKVFLTLLAGIAAFFMILVFADFIQSFFDTASSAGKILEHLSQNKDKA
jgi:hypothetical protein